MIEYHYHKGNEKWMVLTSLGMQILYKNKTAFHFHGLHGNRKGEWSIYLGNTGYRVTMIPCDNNGVEILDGDIMAKCKIIKIICITEVSNHYE